MIRKRNSFLLFLASLIPGAGEMYLGFFRQGLSIMTLFLSLFAFAGMFMAPLMLLTPVIWFYSFFHSNNLNSLPDEEFYSVEDDYFLHINYLFRDNGAFFRLHSKAVAVVLILFGASILWNSFSVIVRYIAYELFHMPDSVAGLIYRLLADMPNSIIAAAIILLGIHLIKNKKDSLN